MIASKPVVEEHGKKWCLGVHWQQEGTGKFSEVTKIFYILIEVVVILESLLSKLIKLHT